MRISISAPHPPYYHVFGFCDDERQLWCGFQSLLGRPPDERVPLHASSAVGTVGGRSSEYDGKKTREKVKMDPHTQESLTTIHRHLMENAEIKGKFMTTCSQLVNDKKYMKEKILMQGGGRDHRIVAAMRARSREDERPMAKDGSYEPASSWEGAPSRPPSSTASNPSNDPSVGDESQLRQQQQERAKQESWLQSYREKKSSQLAGRGNLKLKSSTSSTSSSLSTPVKSGGCDNKSSTPFSIKLRRVGRSNNGSSRPDGTDDNSNDGGASAASGAKQSLSWMEALKMKQRSLRLKQLGTDLDDVVCGGSSSVDEGQTSPAEGSSATPGRTLRSFSPRKKSRMSPPTTPTGSAAPPWMKVQLRSTPKKSATEPSASQPAARPTPQTIEPNGSWNGTSSLSPSSFSLSPVSHTSNHPGNAPTSSTLPPLFCVGDIIDLDSLPKKGFPAAEGEAAIFPLKHSARDLSRGGGRSRGS